MLDAEGERVPDALVEVWNEAEGGRRRSRSVVESRTTDSSGRCAVTASSRRNALLASKSGVGTSGDWPLGGLAEERAEVALVLHPKAEVRGLVLRADGTPAPGATVSFSLFGTSRRGNPLLPPDQLTDAEGRFEVELESSVVAYRLEARDGEKERGEWPVLARAGETKEVTFRFPGAFAISGVLLDPDGGPVAGGGVQVWEAREFAHPALPLGKTKPDGSFRFEMTRLGEFLVAGFADHFADGEPVSVRLTEEAPTQSISLTVAPGSFIHGRVRRETGEPVAGVSVRAWPDRSKGIRPTLRGDLYGEFRTDHLHGWTSADGTFRLAPADPRVEYSVACSPDGAGPEWRIRRRGVVPAGSPVEMVVTEEQMRGAALSGSVESELTGLPLGRFALTLSHEVEAGNMWGSDVTPRVFEDPQGRYRIEGLVVGDRYAIEVGAEGHGNVFVEPWTMEALGKEIRVRLPGPAFLEVHVVDRAGKPVPFAEISLSRWWRSPGWRYRDPLQADEAGIATARGIDPGPYRLWASKGAAHSDPVVAEVRGGSTTVVEIALPR
ncbi:MAG TPA: hypothetical protein VFI25_10280 [Planctomycetota bacterium]|nr:hypothetical protein [Planctomycetota bacterium]